MVHGKCVVLGTPPYLICSDDDDDLWNDSEEAGDARSECDKDEETDCEDGDSDTDW
jgi:hypothetical protein